MIKRIDKNEWNRREIYEMFSETDYPFYSVTIPIDVTEVKKVSKAEEIFFII